MRYSNIKSHLERVQYQIGKPVYLGEHKFRVRGYFANRMALDFKHEPNLLPLLKRILAERNGAFIDVGVNVGQTLVKVLSIQLDRTYIGFEPQIECCFSVSQFIRDNALGNAKILPIALSDHNEICTLFSNGPCDEMASLAEQVEVSGRARQQTTLIAARIGDEVIEEMGLDSIAVIKIDVEGAELQVLSGLKRTLIAYRPIVIFEVMPNFYGHERVVQDSETCSRHRKTADRIYELLSDTGYSISQLNPDGGESAIRKFDLDDRVGFQGFNFVAHPMN